MIPEILQPHRKAVSYCANCPKMCRFACPVALASGSESDTPTAKAHVVRQVMTGSLPLTPATAQPFYRCSECLHSRTHCEHRIEVADHFQAARALAVRAGAEPPAVRRVDESLRRHGNPFGRDLSRAIDDAVPARLRRGDAPVAYFPGCVALAHQPEVVRATIRLLEWLGVKFTVYAATEGCTGYPALSGGYVETFRAQAQRQHEALSRFATVITSCPACAHTFETRYPENGYLLPPRVAHVSEFLMDHAAWMVRAPLDVKPAVYHDPCFLGRYRRTYEPPRVLLGQALGEPPREFVRNRRDAGCCGAGGLLPRSNPEIAREIGRTRLREAADTGARTLVTACPSCRHWFKKLDPALDVRDLVELLAPPTA